MNDKILFRLGKIIASDDAVAAIETACLTLEDFLKRHQRNDSDASSNDRRLNRTAIEHGGHVRSIFRVGKDEVYVETSGERNKTIVCLTSEY